MQDNTEMVKATAEVVVGASLILTPWWSALLADVHFIAATVASVCGASIGIYGLVNILLVVRRTIKSMQKPLSP